MKIITLNIWCGRLGDRLLDFFKANADTDVFLLQEVLSRATGKIVWDARERADIFAEIAEVLPGHRGFFAPSVCGELGQAAYVKESVVLREVGDVFIHGHMDSLIEREALSIGRNLQYLKTSSLDGEPLTIINLHGLWTGNGKDDTEERLEQSRKIAAFVQSQTGKIVLCGDFNLNPETESLKMLERDLGLKNLVKEHGATSTRTSLYTKPGKFADYILVSPNIQVRNFQVLPDEVSDHSPLALEF